MTLVAPFNLENLLVFTFAGSWIMFVLIMIVLIAIMSAKFKMNNLTFGMILSLFAVMVGAKAGWFLFLVVLLGGLLIYYSIGRLVRT